LAFGYSKTLYETKRRLEFQGIDPKLEFSSNSTIQETTVPGTYTELTSIQHNEDSESDSEVKLTKNYLYPA